MRKFEIHKTGLNLFLISAFIYISFSLYAPFLSSYYSKAGISAVEIGVLLTLGPISSILIQPIWAIISDRTGKRKAVLSIVVLGSAFSVLSYYIGQTFLSFFIASTLLAIFSNSIVPLSDAILLRSSHKNHLDFSKIRMGGTIGYAIFVIFAGMIIKRNSDLAYIMGFAGFMVLFVIVRLLPKSESDDLVVKKLNLDSTFIPREKKSLLHIFESKQIYFLLAFAFISQVGLSFHFSFLGVYMLDMGLTEGTIGITNSIAALSEIPVLFLINRVLKKVSTAKITIVACLLLSLRIITITGENLFFVVLSQSLHGLTAMTIYFSCAMFISKNVKPENQSKGQSILALVQTGIGSIVGNILGGYLVDSYGMKPAYKMMSVLVITVAGLMALLQFIYQRKQKSVISE
jgi:oligosaccharide:H+ symporter